MGMLFSFAAGRCPLDSARTLHCAVRHYTASAQPWFAASPHDRDAGRGSAVDAAGGGSIYAAGMLRRARDGSTWRIGTDAEVAWIASGTSPGRAITAGARAARWPARLGRRGPDGQRRQGVPRIGAHETSDARHGVSLLHGRADNPVGRPAAAPATRHSR